MNEKKNLISGVVVVDIILFDAREPSEGLDDALVRGVVGVVRLEEPCNKARDHGDKAHHDEDKGLCLDVRADEGEDGERRDRLRHIDEVVLRLLLAEELGRAEVVRVQVCERLDCGLVGLGRVLALDVHGALGSPPELLLELRSDHKLVDEVRADAHAQGGEEGSGVEHLEQERCHAGDAEPEREHKVRLPHDHRVDEADGLGAVARVAADLVFGAEVLVLLLELLELRDLLLFPLLLDLHLVLCFRIVWKVFFWFAHFLIKENISVVDLILFVL